MDVDTECGNSMNGLKNPGPRSIIQRRIGISGEIQR